MKIQKQNKKITMGKNIIRVPRLSDILPCFMLFLAGRASVIGMYPFGIAMFCGVFQKSVAYLGIGILVLAGASTDAGMWVCKYVLGAILFWLYTRIKEGYRKSTVLSGIVSGICLFSGGVVLTLYYPTGMYDFLVLCIESVLCSFFYVVFDKASMIFTYSKDRNAEQELVSGALCLGILISGVNDIYLPLGMNLSSIITIYAVMSIALFENLAIAGSGGLAAGFICSMSNNAAVTLMGFYGLSSMGANLLKSFGKYGVALGFLGGSAVTLLYIGNSMEIPVSVLEITFGILLFVLTPEKIHKRIGIFLKNTLHPEIVPAEVRMREYLSERLKKAAEAFWGLGECFKKNTEKRLKLYSADICEIFDDTAERICTKCPDFGRCWGENRNNSYRIVFSVLEVLESKGFCNISNAPEEFCGLCSKPELFLTEFAHSYEMHKARVINMGRSKNGRDLVIKQYYEISEMLEEMSGEISEGFCFLPELEKQIAEEMSKIHVNVRDVNAVEDAGGFTEIFLATEKNVPEKALENKLTDVLKIPMGFKEYCMGGVMRFSPKGAFEIVEGTSQLPKEGQNVCGDNLISFRTKDFKYYVLLCDGMGNGMNASKESKITASLAEGFLRAGFSPKMTLNMVNCALALKSDTESFSSADLLSIDLLTGQAEFYKIGGSKSFFWHNDETETLFSESLPAGILSEAYIGGAVRKVSDGDVIIMMSDGVCDGCPGLITAERISKLLEKEYTGMDEVAEAIIKTVLKKRCGRADDDMTVAALKINLIKSE